MAIRVSLISDFQLTAWGLARLFELEPQRFQLVVSAFTFGQSTIDAVAVSSPDVVLLDIDSEPEQVLPFISSLHKAAPDSKILLLTRLDDTTLQDRAVISGARGVIDKHTTSTVLLTAITKVHLGQIWIDRMATGRLFVELSRMSSHPADNRGVPVRASLTDREQQIVVFIANNTGDPGKAVAKKLLISESTLRNHLTSIYEKLGVSNRHGLLAYAFQNGLAKRLT